MQTSHIGTSDVIFRYNGRDGVITDFNGLAYMRARYYSPNMRRFINADILPGELSNSVTLNRFIYANDNPAMYIDPTGYFGVFTLMLIGAAIGAAVGAVSSIVSQHVESELNNEEFELDVGEFVADTFWGAVDGAIAFSPLGRTQMMVAEGLSSLGSAVTNELIDDEAGVNVTRVTESVVRDFVFDLGSMDLTNKKNISKALIDTSEAIENLSKRSNTKWANKQIARLEKEFDDLLLFKIYEESGNGLLDTGLSVFFDKLDHNIDGFINLPQNMDEGFVIFRK